MPREIVHWHVVDLLPQALEAHDPALASLIRLNRNAAYLGAVAHDTPYYYAFGFSSKAQHVAETLHGKDGEDTFQPLFTLAQSIQTSKSDQWHESDLAFLYGMLSHAVVDMQFHPLVIYLTGNYYHPDEKQRKINRAAHRVFEVLLDSYFLHSLEAHCPKVLMRILESNSSLYARVSSLLSRLKLGDERFWSKSIFDTAWCQKRFLQLRYGLLMRALSYVWPSRVKEFDALFSLGRSRAPAYFAEALSYRNPVSGETFSHRIEELIEMSVAETVKVILEVHAQRYTLQGGSLSFGLIGAKNQDATFFKGN